jgi:hypothetical protein
MIQRGSSAVPGFLRALCLLLGTWLLGSFPSAAQSPDKIIDQYLHSTGGARNLEKIETASYTGTLRDPEGGLAGSYSLLLKSPNCFYSEIVLGTKQDIVASNGKSAWAESSGGAPRTLTGISAALAEARGRIWNDRLADWKKDKMGARFVAFETINGRRVSHLELRLAKGVLGDVYFDSETHFLVRESVVSPVPSERTDGIGLPDEFDYSDFRTVDGVAAPYRVEFHRGDQMYTVVISRIEFNGSVRDSTFDFPSVAARPLPDIPTLLRDIVRNQAEIEDLQKKYTCRLSETEEKTDSQGRTEPPRVSDYDVFYVGGEEIRHLLAKNGKPLDGEEKQKEDDRFNKEFDKLEKREAELAANPKKQQKQDEEDQAEISDFLRAERFTNPRRERFRGQDVIVFDFGPNPDYKPKKLIESVVQKLVGVVWVDEQARDVARLEAEFSENAKIAGGLLASLSKGSNFVFEQAMVNNEVWLPSYAEVHASGRILFLHAKANVIDRYSEYRKFQVETHLGSALPPENPSPHPEAPPPVPSPSPR